MLYNTYKSLLKRIDILGVSEPEITIEGEDRIRVKLAGVTDIESARKALSNVANISFRDIKGRDRIYDRNIITKIIVKKI